MTIETRRAEFICISCGEANDGGYEVEDGPGPFCSLCWEKLQEYFAPVVADGARLAAEVARLSDAQEALRADLREALFGMSRLSACEEAFSVAEGAILSALARLTAVPEGLFQFGHIVLHSGATSSFKIGCDALTSADWQTLAFLLAARLPPIGRVEGVPRGGLPLADAFALYLQPNGALLIVDDVLTTGNSMETQRAGRDALGAVVFARGACPAWITPLFTLTPERLTAAPEARDAEPEVLCRDCGNICRPVPATTWRCPQCSLSTLADMGRVTP